MMSWAKYNHSYALMLAVAVKHGRTRSLVERFERREMLNSDEILTSDRSHVRAAEPLQTPPSQVESWPPF